MAALGLVEICDDDAPPPDHDTFWLWPESVPIWNIWQRCQTLWRVGMNGRDGLDYAGLCAYLKDVERIKPRGFVDTFRCIQAMELASLNEWAKQQRDKQSSKG